MYCWSLSENGPFQGRYETVNGALGAAETELEKRGMRDNGDIFVGRVKPAIEYLDPLDIGECLINLTEGHLISCIPHNPEESVQVDKEEAETLGEIVIAYLKGHAFFPVDGITNIQLYDTAKEPTSN